MQLEEIAKQLVASEKGILAADESTGTIEKRLASINVTSTEATRKAWRSLLFTTEGMEQFVSGVILYDETLRMGLGKLLSDKGVLPGIKVDMGAKDLAGFPGEKITEGLDKLRERLAEYVEMGAKFTKWRAEKRGRMDSIVKKIIETGIEGAATATGRNARFASFDDFF